MQEIVYQLWKLLLAELKEIMTVQLFYKYPDPEAQSSEDQIPGLSL